MSWLRPFFRRGALEERLDEEIRAHLAALAEDYVRRGYSPEEARLAALRDFGGVEHIKEQHRDQWRFAIVEAVWRDVRFALRALARNRGFALAAALIVGLGISSCTTVFSVANAVLFRPLPFPHPDELVSVFEYTSRGDREGVAPATFLDWRERNRCFAALATQRPLDLNLTGSGEPEQLSGAAITEGMLELLGGTPAAGRAFRAEDFRASAPGVVMLSYAFWQRRFGGRNVIGESLVLHGAPYSVIGVMPRNFWFFWSRMDVWLPLRFGDRDLSGRQDRASLRSIGRLRPGTSVAQAQASMRALEAGLTAQHPEMSGWGVNVRPLREQASMVRRARPALLLMLAAVGVLMLIVCSNVANLLLLRGASRGREIAVRAALGASRGALAAQFLVESLVLSLAGCGLGLLLSTWGIRLAATLLPEDLRLSLPITPDRIGIDRAMFSFSLAVSVATGLLFGAAPALRLSRPNLAESLKSAGRSVGQGAHLRRFRSVLASGEIALSGLLLVVAALILQSYVLMYTRDLGYRPEDVQVTLLLSIKPATANQILHDVAAIPGVQSAALVDRLPGWPVSWPFDFRQVEFERASEATGRALQTEVRGPYLETMGFRVLRGRTFTSGEQAEERDVAIVNREFARRYGLGPDPSGQRFRPVGSKAWLTIVGMVNDERHPLNGDPMPAFYRPGVERVVPYLMLRASSDVGKQVRERIWLVSADQPVLALPRMDKIVGEARAPVRFGLVLMGTFSFLALVVAALGLYAVVAYGVAARAHEIGVRMALGATRGDIRRLVLAQAVRLAAAGAVGGLVAAIAVSRVLSGVLFGISATDPRTFCAVAAFLFMVAIAAAWHPAQKATRADPVSALRVE